MSGRSGTHAAWRRRAMAVIVGGVVLWPLAHRALVESFQVDPWELFGWAMYSQPAGRVQVRVEVDRDGEVARLRPMGPLREALRDFARRRSALGRLASPDGLVDAIFASDASIERVVLVLRRIRLDPGDARLHGAEERLVFDAPSGGARRRGDRKHAFRTPEPLAETNAAIRVRRSRCRAAGPTAAARS